AEAIRAGELVAMPTETVYGLACDATNPEAVQRVFQAKGRPNDNPLIVHVPDLSWLPRVTTGESKDAEELARRFWPGPLTLILPKHSSISAKATAGLETVAVRVPNHPMARLLCEESDRPIAAPSANLFTHLSPTRIEHLSPEIRSSCKVILDGGPCKVGIESTILDLTSEPPQILRNGQISRSQIESALGRSVAERSTGMKSAPGMYDRHYAPRTPVVLVEKLHARQGGLTFGATENSHQRHMPSEPVNYAFELYNALFELDGHELESICIAMPPETEPWAAIWERLRKASHTA
ncbi:MAG: threonylcarbamoyl-AMP synthase, partial [Armatimonadetes bacterium]|nr:threonylcarbamoyl-AMP synthase [Armatimonadota bacterium]